MFASIEAKLSLRTFVGILLIASLGAILPLQAQTTTATISGTIMDATGAVVAAAKVDVKNVGTGITASTTTNNQGRFRVGELLVGDYEVQASQTGFQTVLRKGITLTVGSEAVIDFTLAVGQAQQTITVEAQASQVDTSSSAVATLVESTQMNDLPLNGRNYTQLIALAPGVQQTTTAGTGSGFYGRQASFSVNGSRPEGQVFLLDNVDVQGFWQRGIGSAVLGTTLGVEALAEFSTQTNTYSAQFGGNGAAINAVTKSGTNRVHGTLFEYLRNSALDSRTPFDGTKIPAFRQNQFGASVGGPKIGRAHV